MMKQRIKLPHEEIIEKFNVEDVEEATLKQIPKEMRFNIIKESLYAIMESLLEHTEYHKPRAYNYIVESIFNNKIIIVIMNK